MQHTKRPLHIRKAQAEDAAALLALYKKLASETPFLTFDRALEEVQVSQQAAHLAQLNYSNEEVVMLAYAEQQLVGVASLSRILGEAHRHVLEVGVGVLCNHWRTGVAETLVRAVLDWAEQQPQVKRLSALVRGDNDRAQALFERLGFVHEGLLQAYVQDASGQIFDAHSLALIIH